MLMLVLSGSLPVKAVPFNSGAVELPDSILQVPSGAQPAVAGHERPVLVRTALKTEEAASTMTIELALKMRNLPELQQRLAKGEMISPSEMATRYNPSDADHQKVVDWLTGQGLTITRTDGNHLAVFASGSVRQIARVFGLRFGRVSYQQGEFTSALTAPRVPAALASVLVGVNGLQPHLRHHKLSILRPPTNTLTPGGNGYSASQISTAYQASNISVNGVTLTGAGQTIGIVIDSEPVNSDLISFWASNGVPESISNVTDIQVVSGTLPATTGEETLDSEWSSAMAPGAKIRIYAITNLGYVDTDQAYQQIYADAQTIPGLRQISLSYSGAEGDIPTGQLEEDSQLLATLASAGITVFVSSGDNGSDAGKDGIQQPGEPSDSPSVVAVGGTTLNLTGTSGTVQGETAWSGSGGGLSTYFARPAWQTGTGMPAGSARAVPDLACVGDPNTGVDIVYQGTAQPIGGTSAGAPICAGFCALINQSRVAAGLPALGSLSPLIYQLLDTSSFRDITVGSNGAYSAGTGYDLCTGVGTPQVRAMVSALNALPVISHQPSTQEIPPAQTATFSVNAYGATAYQWQIMPIGTNSWSNLNDGGVTSGSHAANLTISDVTQALSGNQYQCIVSNGSGSDTTVEQAALVVNTPLSVTTTAGTAGQAGFVTGANALSSTFNQPSGLVFDTAGNLYDADSGNNVIRKITPSGQVSTFATGFNNPNGMVFDTRGNLYVADSGNSAIKKITSSGQVSTFATGFGFPFGIAIDSSNTLYVSDTTNNVIDSVSPQGVVSTFVGNPGSTGAGYADGVGTAAQLYAPNGIVRDAFGNFYVADTGNNSIRKVTSGGTVTTLVGASGASTGGSNDGVGGKAQFNQPIALALDGYGDIYVADSLNNTIRKVSFAGVVSTPAGLASATGGHTDGTGPAATFDSPEALAMDPNGNLIIADTVNNTIRKATPQADAFNGTALGSGWYDSSWFGYYNSTFYPWINDASLGFMYVSTGNDVDIYLYVLNGNPGSMGWLYTTPSVFPSVYSYSRGGWLYYGGGTSFYNFATPGWETY